MWSLYVSVGVIATTIHAADFKDTDGDRAIGRSTMPIVYPSISRYAVLLLLLAWSVVLACIWTLSPLGGVIFVSLGLFTGARFVGASTVRADQVSYYWYNVSCPIHDQSGDNEHTGAQVWLSAVFALPAYHRHRSLIG